MAKSLEVKEEYPTAHQIDLKTTNDDCEEHEMMMKESKNLLDLCQKASHLINILNGYYFYFKGYFDQSQYKNIFNIRYSSVLIPLIILALHQNHTNENDENENEKNGSQDNNNDGNM